MSDRRDGPPRLARRLLERLLPPSDMGAATGDLDEEYLRFIRPERGRARADLWYWRQVLLSAPLWIGRRMSGSRGLTATAGAMAGDVRFALRMLRRRPGFTFASVGTLTLALGVATTAFSVVNAVLVRPLPFAHTDRLVRPMPDELFFLSSSDAVALGERMTSFESVAAWARTIFLFTDGGVAEEVRGARVAWNHFEMLGVDPLLGRTFDRADAAAEDALVLGHGVWVRNFGGDRSIVGSTVDLYGRQMTVVGVLRPDHVPMETDWQAWRTLPLDPAESAGSGMAANALLRPGVTLADASTEFESVLTGIWAEGGYEASPEERARMTVAPLSQWLLGDARPSLLVLSGAVALLLLLACANVANLLLAQARARAREFAIRAAIGGSRARVAGQRFVEVAVLTALGGAGGVIAAAGSLGWFRARLPAEMPRIDQVSVSSEVVLFVALVTVGCALLIGVGPTLGRGRRGLAEVGGSGRSGGASPDQGRFRAVLVGVEMAVAVTLVVGAGLMLRTVTSLQAVDPGFDRDGVVTVRPSPPATRYPPGPELDAYYERVSTEIARVPGVRSVGAIQFLPMTSGGWWSSYRPAGAPPVEGENRPNTAMRVVRGAYFETMRVPLLEGRALTELDGDPDVPLSVVVNRTFVSEAFPDGQAVGREVLLGSDERPARVVGVVGDVRQSDLRTDSHPEVYVPFGRQPWQRLHLVVRTDGDVSAAAAGVGAAVRTVDPEVSLLGPRPMREVVGRTFGDASLVATLLALFGAIGLAIGAVGVYGVTSQSVAERRREIGIRIALGQASSEVATRTVVAGMVPVALGLGAGLLGATAGVRALESLVFGVDPLDPGTFLAAPVVLLLVAFASLAVPALRASRVDPVVMLREE